MPSDINQQLTPIDQIQGAMTGIDNEQLVSSLQDVMDKANGSANAMGALDGIIRSLTADGKPLSESLDKLVACFGQYESIIGRSSISTGIMSGRLSGMMKPVQSVADGLSRLTSEVHSLNATAAKMDLSSGIDAALPKINAVIDRIKHLQGMTMKGVTVNVQERHAGGMAVTGDVKRGRSYAKGGSVVRYNGRNTAIAVSGGRFIGRKDGDREMAFVNAGEAILTERALKRGARQAGMSVGRYVNRLNSGDISSIKKGRSFAEGTSPSEPGSKQKKAAGERIQREFGFNPNESQLNLGGLLKDIIDLLKNIENDKNKSDDTRDIAGWLKDTLSSSKNDPMKAGSLAGLLNQQNSFKGKSLNDIIADMSNGNSGTVNILKNLKEDGEKIAKILKGYESKILSLGDAIDKVGEDNLREFQYEMTRTFGDGFGKLINDSEGKIGKLLKSFGALAIGIKSLGSMSSWVSEQASLSAGFDKAAVSAQNWANVTRDSFEKISKGFSLTRKQMVDMGSAMSEVGKGGMTDGSVIESMAAGMKSAFGEIDISALKEAAKIFKDLPKEQAAAMFAPGSFENEANALTNLVNNGQLDQVIELQMKGAFGEKAGMAQLSEKDRMVVEAQQETNKLLDSIDKLMYDFLPNSMAEGSQTMRGVVDISKKVGRIMTGVAPLLGAKAAYKKVSSGTVNVHEVGSGSGMKVLGKNPSGSAGGSGGLLRAPKTFNDKIDQTFRILGKKIGSKFGGKSTEIGKILSGSLDKFGGKLGGGFGNAFQSGGWGGIGGQLFKNLSGSMMKMGPQLGSQIAVAILAKIAKNNNRKSNRLRVRNAIENGNASKNEEIYGNSMGRNLAYDKLGIKASSLEGGTKSMMAFAGAVAAVGAAVGSVVPGLGTLSGAITGLLVGAAAGMLAGGVGYLSGSKFSKNKELNKNILMTENKTRSVWDKLLFGGRLTGWGDLFNFGSSTTFADRGRKGKKDVDFVNSQIEKHAAAKMGMSGRFEVDEKTGLAKARERVDKDGVKVIEYLDKQTNTWMTMEKAQQNSLKQLIALNKNVKQIDNIAKGIYSSYARATIQAHANNIAALSTMGGTNKSFKTNVQGGMANSIGMWRNDFTALQRAKNNTVNDKTMSDAQKAVALNKVMDAELKVHQNFIAQMKNFVGQVGKMPELMEREIREGVRRALDDFQSANMVGGINDAFESGMSGTVDAGNNLRDTVNYAASSMSNLLGHFERMSKEFENYGKVIDEKLKELNGGKEFGDEDAQKYRDAQAELERMRSDAGIHDMAGLRDELNANSNVFSELQKKKEDELDEHDMAQAISAFKALEEHAQNALDEKNAIGDKATKEDKDMIRILESMLQNIKGGINAAEQGDKESLKKSILAQGEQGGKIIEQFKNTEAAKIDAKLLNDFRKMHPDIKVDKMQTVLSLLRAKSGASDQKVAMETMKSEEIKSIITKYEKISKDLVSNMKHVLENGAVQFKNAMADTLKRRQQYMMARGGSGADVVSKIFQSSAEALSARAESIESGRELVRKNLNDLDNLASDENLNKEEYKNYTTDMKEAAKLMQKAESARLRALLNPEDTNAQGDAEKALLARDKAIAGLKGKKAEDHTTDALELLKVFETALGSETAPIKLFVETVTKQIEDTFAQWEKLPKMIENALAGSYPNRIARAKTEESLSKVDYINQFGDYNEAVNESLDSLKFSKESYDMDMKVIEEIKQKQKADAKDFYDNQIKQAGNNQKKIAAINNYYNEQLALADKEYYDNKLKIAQRRNKEINDAFAARTEKSERIGKALDIQKDVANSIGAPFEFVLQIEQNIVKLAREQAKIEEDKLAEMEASGKHGKVLEDQKLKVAEAQAKVLKAAFGAQRDSLDKMLGKMMGTFTDVGGIFGPDGARMLARKYGQGYTTNESGMAMAAGPNSTLSYEQRRYKNAGIAVGIGSPQGTTDYGSGWGSGNTLRNVLQRTGSMIGGFAGGKVGGKSTVHMSFNDIIDMFGRTFLDENNTLKQRSAGDTELAFFKPGEKIIPENGAMKSAMNAGVSDTGLADAYRNGNVLGYLAGHSPVLKKAIDFTRGSFRKMFGHGVEGHAEGKVDGSDQNYASSGTEYDNLYTDLVKQNKTRATETQNTAQYPEKGGVAGKSENILGSNGLFSGAIQLANEGEDPMKVLLKCMDKMFEYFETGVNVKILDENAVSFDKLDNEINDLQGSFAKKREQAFKKAGFGEFAQFSDKMFGERIAEKKAEMEKAKASGNVEQYTRLGNEISIIESLLSISQNLKFINRRGKRMNDVSPSIDQNVENMAGTNFNPNVIGTSTGLKEDTGVLFANKGESSGGDIVSAIESLKPSIDGIRELLANAFFTVAEKKTRGKAGAGDSSGNDSGDLKKSGGSSGGSTEAPVSGDVSVKGHATGMVGGKKSIHLPFGKVTKMFGSVFKGEKGLEHRSSGDTELALFKRGEKIIPEKGAKQSAKGLGVSDYGLADAYRKGRLAEFLGGKMRSAGKKMNRAAGRFIRGFAGGNAGDVAGGSAQGTGVYDKKAQNDRIVFLRYGFNSYDAYQKYIDSIRNKTFTKPKNKDEMARIKGYEGYSEMESRFNAYAKDKGYNNYSEMMMARRKQAEKAEADRRQAAADAYLRQAMGSRMTGREAMEFETRTGRYSSGKDEIGENNARPGWFLGYDYSRSGSNESVRKKKEQHLKQEKKFLKQQDQKNAKKKERENKVRQHVGMMKGGDLSIDSWRRQGVFQPRNMNQAPNPADWRRMNLMFMDKKTGKYRATARGYQYLRKCNVPDSQIEICENLYDPSNKKDVASARNGISKISQAYVNTMRSSSMGGIVPRIVYNPQNTGVSLTEPQKRRIRLANTKNGKILAANQQVADYLVENGFDRSEIVIGVDRNGNPFNGGFSLDENQKNANKYDTAQIAGYANGRALSSYLEDQSEISLYANGSEGIAGYKAGSAGISTAAVGSEIGSGAANNCMNIMARYWEHYNGFVPQDGSAIMNIVGYVGDKLKKIKMSQKEWSKVNKSIYPGSTLDISPNTTFFDLNPEDVKSVEYYEKGTGCLVNPKAGISQTPKPSAAAPSAGPASSVSSTPTIKPNMPKPATGTPQSPRPAASTANPVSPKQATAGSPQASKPAATTAPAAAPKPAAGTPQVPNPGDVIDVSNIRVMTQPDGTHVVVVQGKSQSYMMSADDYAANYKPGHKLTLPKNAKTLKTAKVVSTDEFIGTPSQGAPTGAAGRPAMAKPGDVIKLKNAVEVSPGMPGGAEMVRVTDANGHTYQMPFEDFANAKYDPKTGNMVLPEKTLKVANPLKTGNPVDDMLYTTNTKGKPVGTPQTPQAKPGTAGRQLNQHGENFLDFKKRQHEHLEKVLKEREQQGLTGKSKPEYRPDAKSGKMFGSDGKLNNFRKKTLSVLNTRAGKYAMTGLAWMPTLMDARSAILSEGDERKQHLVHAAIDSVPAIASTLAMWGGKTVSKMAGRAISPLFAVAEAGKTWYDMSHASDEQMQDIVKEWDKTGTSGRFKDYAKRAAVAGSIGMLFGGPMGALAAIGVDAAGHFVSDLIKSHYINKYKKNRPIDINLETQNTGSDYKFKDITQKPKPAAPAGTSVPGAGAPGKGNAADKDKMKKAIMEKKKQQLDKLARSKGYPNYDSMMTSLKEEATKQGYTSVKDMMAARAMKKKKQMQQAERQAAADAYLRQVMGSRMTGREAMEFETRTGRHASGKSPDDLFNDRRNASPGWFLGYNYSGTDETTMMLKEEKLEEERQFLEQQNEKNAEKRERENKVKQHVDLMGGAGLSIDSWNRMRVFQPRNMNVAPNPADWRRMDKMFKNNETGKYRVTARGYQYMRSLGIPDDQLEICERLYDPSNPKDRKRAEMGLSSPSDEYVKSMKNGQNEDDIIPRVVYNPLNMNVPLTESQKRRIDKSNRQDGKIIAANDNVRKYLIKNGYDENDILVYTSKNKNKEKQENDKTPAEQKSKQNPKPAVETVNPENDAERQKKAAGDEVKNYANGGIVGRPYLDNLRGYADGMPGQKEMVGGRESYRIRQMDIAGLFGGSSGGKARPSGDNYFGLFKKGEVIVPPDKALQNANDLGVSNIGLADSYRKGHLGDFLENNGVFMSGYAKGRNGETYDSAVDEHRAETLYGYGRQNGNGAGGLNSNQTMYVPINANDDGNGLSVSPEMISPRMVGGIGGISMPSRGLEERRNGQQSGGKDANHGSVDMTGGMDSGNYTVRFVVKMDPESLKGALSGDTEKNMVSALKGGRTANHF